MCSQIGVKVESDHVECPQTASGRIFAIRKGGTVQRYSKARLSPKLSSGDAPGLPWVSGPETCAGLQLRGYSELGLFSRGVEALPTLDSQVHAYERNHPSRPWVGTLYGPAEVTRDQMVAAMDAVGVDGAILVSPFRMYRYASRFTRHIPTASDWCRTKGTVGIRIFLRAEVSTNPADAVINRILATAAQHSLPVNVACAGR